MLVGIVQQDNLKVGIELHQMPYAAQAILAYSHRHIRQIKVHLHRLIADRESGGSIINQTETACAALIAPREHGHPEVAAQNSCDELGMRRLARPAYRQIAYADRRHADGEGMQEMLVVEHVTDKGDQTVNPRGYQTQQVHIQCVLRD